MVQVQSTTDAAVQLVRDNQAQRRAARSAELSALSQGATAEEALAAFTEVMQGAPAPDARAYVEQAVQMLNVTPDGFIALLRTQVSREDQKVMDSRNAIENALSQSRDLSQRMQALQQIHQRASQAGNDKVNLGTELITLNGREMPIGEAVVAYGLVDTLDLTARHDPDNPDWYRGVELRADVVQGAIDMLRQEQQTVTSSNELNMIAMQQAMQQRGQHLQLVSKVLAMMGDTERAIVGNMR